MRNTVVEDTSLRKILVRPEKMPFSKIKIRPWRGNFQSGVIKLQDRQVSKATGVVDVTLPYAGSVRFLFVANIY